MANMMQIVGAGLKDAKVVKSDGSVIDIYGVVTVGGEVDRESTEVRGDDALLATFNSSIRENITIDANALSLDAIQAITGNTAASTTSSSAIATGTDSELNPPFIGLIAYTNAKSADGSNVVIRKTWHKVQLTQVQVSQQGEQEFQFHAEGYALQTSFKIDGTTALNPKRIADIDTFTGTW